MNGLPAELIAECRVIFMECAEFQSIPRLRAVFITEELVHYRFSLPDRVESIEDLVDKIIELFITRENLNHQPIIIFLVRVLRDRYPSEDFLHAKLDTLLNKLSVHFHSRHFNRHHSFSNSPQAIFDLLLKLDYREQVRKYQAVLQKSRVAAFLVHGELEAGQQVLVNRLIQMLPHWQIGHRITIDLGSRGSVKSPRAIWQSVAHALGFSTNVAQLEVSKKIYDCVASEGLYFVFHSVECLPDPLLNALIDDFWKPLSIYVNDRLDYLPPKSFMCLFLVDYKGCVCQGEVAKFWKDDLEESVSVPIRLPSVSVFTIEAIDTWIGFASDLLPSDLSAEIIYQNSSSGIPLQVYDYVCAHCGLNWEGELSRWLI